MKKLKIHIYLFVGCLYLLMATGCDTENSLESPDKDYFMKLYGEDGDQTGVDMIALNDGNLLLLGNSVLASGIKKIHLLKVDPEGKIIWQKKYGGTTDEANDIEPMANGNFVILSTFTNPANQSSDLKLIRITPTGDKIDSVIYGTTANEYAQAVTPLLDGGAIVTGATEWAETAGFINIFHYRCNANLVFLEDTDAWDSYHGPVGDIDEGLKVFQITDSVFYVFAYSTQAYSGKQIIKQSKKSNFQYYSLNAVGTSNNPAYVGGDERDLRLSFVSKVPNELGGGFLIIGTETTATGATDMFVSKLTSNLAFDPQDHQMGKIGQDIPIGNRVLEAVSATTSLSAPTGYLLLANEMGILGTNIWLTKIDQSARVQWSISLGSGDLNDSAAAIHELPDGKIIVLGTVGIADNQSKMALFKLNSTGRLQD
jgi:hypothetical protein